jgi:hypothetical protein
MPSTTRGWARRKLTSASTDINKTGTHLNEVIHEYEQGYKHVSEPLVKCLELLAMCDKLITQIKETI